MPKKILLVDDERDITEALSRTLSRRGYACATAASGKEALEKAKSALPDLILLDIVLGDLDGGEVKKALSADKATAGIPIIFLTGLLTPEEEGALKGDFYLSKPVALDKLLELIEKVKR